MYKFNNLYEITHSYVLKCHIGFSDLISWEKLFFYLKTNLKKLLNSLITYAVIVIIGHQGAVQTTKIMACLEMPFKP